MARRKSKSEKKSEPNKLNASAMRAAALVNMTNNFWTEVVMQKKVGEKVTYVLYVKGSGIKAVNVEVSYPANIINFSKSTNNPAMFDLVVASLINDVEGKLQISAARTDAGTVSPVNGDWITRLEFNCVGKGICPMIITKKTMLDAANQAIPNVGSLDNSELEVIEEIVYMVWFAVE